MEDSSSSQPKVRGSRPGSPVIGTWMQRAMEEATATGRRERQPTQRFTYPQLGVPSYTTFQIPTKKKVPVACSKAASRKSASSSVMSFQTRLRSVHLDKTEEMDKTAVAHQKHVNSIQVEIQEKERKIEELQKVAKDLESIPVEFRDDGYAPELRRTSNTIIALSGEIVNLKGRISNAKRDLKMDKASILRSLEVEKKKLQLEEEDAKEQQFDSEEETVIQGWTEPHTPPPASSYYGDHQFVSNQRDRLDDNGSDHFGTVVLSNRRNSTAADVNDKVMQVLSAQLKLMEKGGERERDRDLPTFAGRAEDWSIFINEYQRTTSRNPSQGEKSRTLIRLRKALKGSAKEAVAGLLDDPESLPDIIQKLKSRFGRAEFILNALIAKVRDSKPPKADHPASIIQFGTEVQNLVVRVKAMKETRYLYDISLLKELTSKLPHSYAEQWILWLRADPTREKNLSTFAEWLDVKVAVAEELYHPVIHDELKKDDRREKRQHGVHAAAPEEVAPSAELRQKIPILRNLNLDERWKVVKEMRLCYVCLKQGHGVPKCKVDKKCEVDNCGMRHHRLLHRSKSESSHPRSQNVSNRQIDVTPPSSPPAEVDPDLLGNMSVAQCSGSLPIIPVWVSGPKGRKKIYALLDSGASFTVMEEAVAEEVGLEGKAETLNYTVFGDKRSERSTTVKFEISGSFQNAKVYPIKEGHTCRKLGIPGISLNTDDLKIKYPHLRRMRAKSLDNAVPQMLIGYDCYNLFYSKLALEPKENSDEPYAFKSKLGWYVLEKGAMKTISFAFPSNSDEELHATVKQFFTTESFGTKPILNSERSKEDRRALELLEKHTVKKDNRWETCLLWNSDHVELPESKHMAMKRLRGMEKKMDSSPEFAEMTQKKFDDYIAKGFLIPRSKKDVEGKQKNSRKWYLPWFFSYHPTKKPRLVFDAAAKSNGMSLNDYLLKGPDLLNPLPSVLTRFRRHQVAITGDIKEMFHQVQLREEDWPSQTILYRGIDRTKEPEEYYMSVLFFGAASSPCSAIFAKNKNAEQFREKYPVAVEAIVQDFYMDDYLGGAATEDDAINLQREVAEIHLAGGFQVVKWNSSSEKVFKSIPEEIRAEGDISFAAKDDIHVEKTLGLYWSPSHDQFCFRLNFHRVKKEVSSGEQVPTKREMVSMVMALFDPLGFLSPLKIRALILIQDVWRSGIGWDDEVPISIFQKWKEWLTNLKSVGNVKVPRKLTSFNVHDKVEMHVFCDASEEAFASVAYLTFETGGNREVAFVAGKCRVAPLRGLTVPKMELQAALLGSRLSRTIMKTFDECLQISVTHFWSDSKSVLCQIRSSTLRFKMFEANRIGEILELTDVDQWKWISTLHNVADDATRSSSTCEISTGCRWLKGSDFLFTPETDWPKEKMNVGDSIPLAEMGVKVVATVVASALESSPFIDVQRFSSFQKLLRYTACLFLSQRRWRKTGPGYITLEEMEKAKLYLVRNSQMESFPEEYESLKCGEEIRKSSRLYKLSPILNEDGLIVLNGRINEAVWISAAVKNPPILSPKHHFSRLLIQWHHEKNQHHGQEKAVNDLRQEFWMLDCRAAVRSCWAKCLKCKIRCVRPQQPEMGQLPVARLGENHHPFHHTGVDYFGPLTVSIGRKTYKRWGALFTCLSTRAVHLELVDSLDTGDMINALVRFVCVRGKPAHLWSDNGTNFIGANREMKDALKTLDHGAVHDRMLSRGIRWHNIPPSSPFMGGAWESLIGIVKRILNTMLKERNPKETTLRTLFAEVMEIMNNRPLTYASADPDDPECITPNLLLRLKSTEYQSIPGTFSDGDRFRRMWRYGQFLADEFWVRFTREYLPKLAKREKWNEKADPLQVGDLVLVVDDQSPRSGWRKGVVTAVFPGKDRQVRVADVRVAHLKDGNPKSKPFISTYRRPASKICPLGIRIASSRWEGGMEAADST